MYHDDHPPAHIHVEYQGFVALMNIKNAEVIKGKLPNKALKIVQDWHLAQALMPLDKIPGADND